ncbi:MAG: hypothetical protein BIFFINMI_00069 [Phycisphaerae bacterium]|nr:hypothetical protein [Phycisphaerae bacterium]
MKSLRHAIGFCFGLREPTEPADSAAWTHWVVPAGAGLGTMLAAVTAISWYRLHLWGYGLWMAVMPALLILWLGPGAGRVVGFARTFSFLRQGRRFNRDNDLDGDPLTGGLMVVGLVAAGLLCYIAMATLPTEAPPAWALPHWLDSILRPRKLYAVIVLMSTWGGGAVLLSGLLGKPAESSGPMVRQLLAVGAWRKILWGWLVPTALTTFYFSNWWLGGWASAVATGVIEFGVIALLGWIMARRGQGHCRDTLLAAGVLGELLFLLLFHVLVK